MCKHNIIDEIDLDLGPKLGTLGKIYKCRFCGEEVKLDGYDKKRGITKKARVVKRG
jgi:hypothetical protein